jgi:small subunit ribosomal protein S17
MATKEKSVKQKSEKVEKAVNRQSLTGVVVSRKMEKTATVRVSRFVAHPIYKKHIKSDKKYLVHDPKNETKVGDKVTIVSIRPMSKHKRFQIAAVIGHMDVKEKVRANT